MTERKFVTVNKDASPAKRKAAYKRQNQIVAFEVVQALSLLHDMYYHDFIDTSEAGKRDCIYKKPSQSLTNWRGENITFFESKYWMGKYGPKVCSLRIFVDQFRNFCAGDNKECTGVYYKKKSHSLTLMRETMGIFGGMKSVPIPAWSTNYRVFEKNKNEWVYTFKTKGKYTYYGPFKTKAEAEASRVARAMMSYRDILGDIPGMVRQWEKLVLAIGTHQNKSDAIRLVNELGVRR